MTFSKLFKLILFAVGVGTAQIASLAVMDGAYANQPFEDVGVSAYPAPPSGFEPDKAEASDLEMFGFPPRPSMQAPVEERARWNIVTTKPHRVRASILRSNVVHRLPNTSMSEGAGISAAYSHSWSGGVLLSGTQALNSRSFSGAAGEIEVPVAQTPFGVCPIQPVYASEWVGLDGYGSRDIVQAGVETDSVCRSGIQSPSYYAWLEWYPGSAYKIMNMPITPGSLIYVSTTLTSSTTALIYMVNETANIAVSLKLTVPNGASFVGSSAEWIVERPQVGGLLTSLTNYVGAFIGLASATLNDGHGTNVQPGLTVPPMQLYNFYMVDNNSQIISFPSQSGPTGFKFVNAGSAR